MIPHYEMIGIEKAFATNWSCPVLGFSAIAGNDIHLDHSRQSVGIGVYHRICEFQKYAVNVHFVAKGYHAIHLPL